MHVKAPLSIKGHLQCNSLFTQKTSKFYHQEKSSSNFLSGLLTSLSSKKMKLFSLLLISVLLLQVFTEGLALLDDSSNSPTQMDDEYGEKSTEALHKKLHKPHKINCSHACSRRCSKASRKKICHRACKTCCTKCNCVPPGTYGHKEVCPCYARLRTKGNKLKCP